MEARNIEELKLQAIVSHLMWALVLKFGFAARVVCAEPSL